MLFGIINALFVLLTGWVAWEEGRLTHGQLGPQSIPWLYHGAVWADLIALSPVIGIAMSYRKQWQPISLVWCLLIGLVVSVALHLVFAKMQAIPGHIIDPAGKGLGKFPVNGRLHFLYTTIGIAIALMFYLGTHGVPRFWVSFWLTLYIPVAIIQPGWYMAKVSGDGGRIDITACIGTIAILAVLWTGGYGRFGGLLKP